jgi:hypothetical protein
MAVGALLFLIFGVQKNTNAFFAAQETEKNDKIVNFNRK